MAGKQKRATSVIINQNHNNLTSQTKQTSPIHMQVKQADSYSQVR